MTPHRGSTPRHRPAARPRPRRRPASRPSRRAPHPAPRPATRATSPPTRVAGVTGTTVMTRTKTPDSGVSGDFAGTAVSHSPDGHIDCLPMDIQVADSLLGTLVDGRYRIRGRVARGGMATVYTATDERLERTVALKIIHPAQARDPDFLERFTDEAKTIARLTHPNVVAVYDQGRHAGLPYLVMEYVRGHTLRDVLAQRRRLNPGEALAILEQMLAAICRRPPRRPGAPRRQAGERAGRRGAQRRPGQPGRQRRQGGRLRPGPGGGGQRRPTPTAAS